MSSDYGVTWTGRDSNRSWSGVAMSSDGRIQTALHYNGLIYTSTNYGITWAPRGSVRNWYYVAMSSDGRIQTATVYGGQIYLSTDYGVTWTPRDSSKDWRNVAMSSDGRIQTAAVYGGLLYTSYATTYSPNPVTVSGLLSSTGVIYASGGSSDQWNSNYTTTNTNSANWSAYTQNFGTFNTNLATLDPTILWVSTLSGVIPSTEIFGRLSTSRGKITGRIFMNTINSATNKTLYLRFANNNVFASPTNIINAGNATTQTLIRTFEGILLPGNQIIFNPSQGNVEDGVRSNPFTTYNYIPGDSIFYQIGLSIGSGSEFVAISGGYISVTPD